MAARLRQIQDAIKHISQIDRGTATPAFSPFALGQAQTIGSVATLISAPAGIAIMLFLTSLVFLALTRFILGGETTYKHVLTVNCLSSLICIPSAIVSVPLMLAKESVYVQVGFGLLLPDSMAETFLARLLFNLNFFAIWQYALVGIGLGIVAGISIRKAATRWDQRHCKDWREVLEVKWRHLGLTSASCSSAQVG